MKPENETPIERHGPITRNAHWFVVALLWPILFLLGPVKVVGRYRENERALQVAAWCEGVLGAGMGIANG